MFSNPVPQICGNEQEQTKTLKKTPLNPFPQICGNDQQHQTKTLKKTHPNPSNM
jgi:hypothetical protein